MKIPRKIRVAGRDFDVLFKKRICEDQGCIGLLIYDDSTFILKGPRDSEYTKSVFIHECIHLCNRVLSKQGTYVDSEQYVGPMAELLFQIIKQVEV